jgi:two-component system, sensor histidine kinase and response regulator
LAVERHGRREDLTIRREGCSIRVQPTDLTRIVEELVDNASKFSRFGTLLEILLGSDGALQITDEGRGMSEEEISLIGAFRQFERAKHEQQGLGLGLISVQKPAARNGAKFSVARGPEQGILVRIEFQPGNGKAEA